MKSGGKSSEVSPRGKAKLMYLRSGCKKSLQLIAKEIGASYDTVKSWKRRDRWDDDPKATPKGANAPASAPKKAPDDAPEQKRKRGAQPGNKNAVYGDGGGPPEGNQNAFTTGEYARILFTDLTDEERALLAAMPDNTVDLMKNDLALLCVREKRMLRRIQELQQTSQNGMVYSEITNRSTTQTRGNNGNTETTESTYTTVAPAIDRIGDIEEALTRLRREKQRIINALNEYEEKRLRNAQNNPFAASDAVQDSNRRMMTFADLLLHPAANRELSVLEGESSD